MKGKVNFDIIKKYLGGKHTFEELKKLKFWFSNAESEDELKDGLSKHWDEFGLTEDHTLKDLSNVYQKLKSNINQDHKVIPVRRQLVNFYYKIAAVLLLPLLIYSAYTFVNEINTKGEQHWVEITSPYGTRTNFNLPDGTAVTLNSGTVLKYNAEFKRNRLVDINGEAYFDVFHDKTSPFVVQTESFKVKVLGTKFSVDAYDKDQMANVILEEGKVQLLGADNTFSEVLKPNENFIFSREDNSGVIVKADAKYKTSWKDGILTFRNEPLSDVLQRLGRWYNVKFEILDKDIENLKYRATFKDEPLEEVLRLISLTVPIKYDIKNRQINENGYESKTVIIKLK